MELKKPFFPKGMEIPLKRIVPASWMPLVLEGEKVNRTAYEICVLKALREQLRCREIWVVGSRRYRNPEDDLPQDFAANRGVYFEDLGIPMDPKTFTASLREELTMHLKALDERIPTNPKVKIVSKKDGSKYAYPVDTGWRFEVETGACQITLEPCWSFSISSTVY
jgi:hypothetical protein